jgi:hypothetical protein
MCRRVRLLKVGFDRHLAGFDRRFLGFDSSGSLVADSARIGRFMRHKKR